MPNISLANIYLSTIPWPFLPVWVVVDNTKKTPKQWGLHSVLLAMTRDPVKFGWHCWSDTAHPPPSSTTYVASYATSLTAPTTGLPHIRQPCGNSRCQSELRHNRSPLISIPSTLTYLPHIHPPIIQDSLLHPSTQT